MFSQARELAVITGASSGIGFELAKLAAESGYDLIIAADDPAIHKAAESLRTTERSVEVIEADLSTFEGADKLYVAVKSIGMPAAILKVQNFPDSQIRRKMIQGWDAAFALPSVRSEGRMRDVSRHAEGARRQY